MKIAQASGKIAGQAAYTQGKSNYHYETASGRSNWPNRDPIEEFGHHLKIKCYILQKDRSLEQLALFDIRLY